MPLDHKGRIINADTLAQIRAMTTDELAAFRARHVASGYGGLVDAADAESKRRAEPPTPPFLYCWVRCGDGDHYHRFANLSNVAAYLLSMQCKPHVERHNEMGVTDNDYYRGQNYISLYHGGAEIDDDTDPTYITDAEIAELNGYLKRS